MPAVVLLPNWNAKWHGQRGLCEWLQRIGIYRSPPEPPLPRPPHGQRPRARRPTRRPEHRPNPPGQPPSRPGHPPLPTVAGTARLHPPGHPGHQHRFLGRLHHHGSRRSPPRRRLLPRLHLFRRRSEPRHDHHSRLGKPASPRHGRRTPRLLGPRKPHALRTSAAWAQARMPSWSTANTIPHSSRS